MNEWQAVGKKRSGKPRQNRTVPTSGDTLAELLNVVQEFKTCNCDLDFECANAKQCIYIHSWEDVNFVARRNPFSCAYEPELCESHGATSTCPRGVSCPFAHTKFEQMYHPTRYKSLQCQDGKACKRGTLCAFAHGALEEEAAANLAVLWVGEQAPSSTVVGADQQRDISNGTLGAFLPSVPNPGPALIKLPSREWAKPSASSAEVSHLAIGLDDWQVEVLQGSRGKAVQAEIDERARRCGMQSAEIMRTPGTPWQISLCAPADDCFDKQAAIATRRINEIWWDAKVLPRSDKNFSPRDCRFVFDSFEGQALVAQVKTEKKLDAMTNIETRIFAWGTNEKSRTQALHQLELLVRQQEHSADREQQDAKLQAVQQEMQRLRTEYFRLHSAYTKQESELLGLQLEFSKVDSMHIDEAKARLTTTTPPTPALSSDAAMATARREHHRFWQSDANDSAEPLSHFELDERTVEWDEVRSHFLSTIESTKPVSVVRITRIQNTELFDHYLLKKKKMSYPNEKWLFHGADHKAIHSIVRTGFNRSYAGKNATAYGKGCYFALNSSYSNNYSSRDAAGERRMLLAWVLVGMYCPGDSSMCAPADGFHSTANRARRPTIFVTYNDTQSYPAYEVVYKTG